MKTKPTINQPRTTAPWEDNVYRKPVACADETAPAAAVERGVLAWMGESFFWLITLLFVWR